MTLKKRKLSQKEYESQIKKLETTIRVLKSKVNKLEKVRLEKKVKLEERHENPDLELLIKIVSEKTNVPVSTLRLNARVSREISEYRHIFCFLSKKHIPKISYSEIGRYLGNRDHTTIMHSFLQHLDLNDTDKEHKKLSDEIEREFVRQQSELQHKFSESSIETEKTINGTSSISE
jgi:chromosomal replication initiator protein